MFSLRQFHRKENIYYTNNEPLKKNGSAQPKLMTGHLMLTAWAEVIEC